MFDPFDAAQSRDAWAALWALARRGSGRDGRRRAAVCHALRRGPRGAARHRHVLERVGHEGARRRHPVRGPAPRRARSAASHRGAPRHGHRDDTEGRARGRAVHRRDGRGAARRAPARPVRSRHVVHGRAPQPRDGVPARLRSRRRRPARALGEGSDGEHVPRAQPHRTRRRLRGRVPRVRGLHRRAHRERSAQLDAGESRDDVLARLIRLEVDDAPLPPQQLRALVRNLITGGLTTTSQLLGNLLHSISRPARPRGRACAPTGRCSTTAIEESLRTLAAAAVPRRAAACATPRSAVARCTPGERVVVGAASGEPRRARLRRRRRVPRRSRQRRPAPHVRLRPPRVPGRHACARGRAHRRRRRARPLRARRRCNSSPASCSSRSRRTSSTARAACRSCVDR